MEDFTGKSRVHQGVCRSHSSIQIELDLFKCTGLCVWVPTLTYKHAELSRGGTSLLPRPVPSLSSSDPVLCAQQLGPAVRGLAPGP